MNTMTSNMIVWAPGVTLEAVEEQIIKRALHHYRGNKTLTAQVLGIAIRTLDNKLEKYFEAEKKQEQNVLEEKKRREDFLARCRGQVPPSELDKGGEIANAVKNEEEKGEEANFEDSIQTSTLRTKRRG